MDLQFVFEDQGAQVIGPVMTLEQALCAASSEPTIDAAILDVDIGGRDVFPVAARLRERGVPFVFHTGHGSPRELGAMYPESMTCVKPVRPETLIATLLRVVC